MDAISWTEILTFFFVLFQLRKNHSSHSFTPSLTFIAFVLFWAGLKFATSKGNISKPTWRRVLGYAGYRFVTRRWNIRQFQWALGTSYQVYVKWARKNNLEMIVDDLGNDTQLLWIGPRNTDHVVLYLHGKSFQSRTESTLTIQAEVISSPYRISHCPFGTISVWSWNGQITCKSVSLFSPTVSYLLFFF